MCLSCKPDYCKALESRLPCHICKLSLQFADFNMKIQPQILALPDAHLQSA